MARRFRTVNTQLTPDNLVQIWNAIHALQDTQTDHTSQLADHATQLNDHVTAIQSANATANQAIVVAGQAQTDNSTGGSGTGSGGTQPSPPPTGGDTHPNHLDLVTQAKTDLTTEGADLSGSCGAFKIVQRAVQYIQPSDPSAGFLSKPDGNNCNGFAVDIICYSDGVIYDVLSDAGATNGPQWSFAGTVDVGRYRATSF